MSHGQLLHMNSAGKGFRILKDEAQGKKYIPLSDEDKRKLIEEYFPNNTLSNWES